MTRVKRGFVARARRKRVFQLARGFRGSHSVLFRTAQQRTLKALANSYSGRRQKKRQMRQLWIRRLNASLRNFPSISNLKLNYSKFQHKLKLAHIQLNRKVLSQLSIQDPLTFMQLTQI